jgi:hypothetical protein
MYHFLRGRLAGGPLRVESIVPLLVGISAALFLTLIILVLSLRTGVAKIRDAEIYAGDGA